MGKSFQIRIGADEAAFFLDGHTGHSRFASTAFDKVIGETITIDGAKAKVLDAVVLEGGYAAELMVEIVEEDCDCLPVGDLLEDLSVDES